MRSALSGGSLEIVKLLREKNIPLSFEPNISGWTPLHRAAANNKPDMLEYLIKEGADINFRTKAGLSIYNIAEENGHNELLNLILKLGGNAESQKFPILTGLYLGQKPPGKMPERFAPDIFIYNHSTVTVSPDGKEMYWNSGPKFGEGPIMMTKIVDGKWIKPVEAPFSGKQYSKFDDCPFVSPDNKRLFFISMRPLGSRTDNKENIWYVERTSSGWSEPKPVSEEINAMKLHWQISVSKNGTLYFNGRDKEGSSIRYSRCVNGVYAKPENIGIDGMSPFIAPDESYLIFTKLVSNRPNPFICFKSKESKWNEPIDLQQYIGPGVCCIVSPDGKYLFKDSYWVDASFIEELRPKELNSQSAVMGQGKLGSNDNLVYTILYNNTSVSDSIIADHGFSCLIESGDHSCLFDAGRISDKFMTNVSKLGVNYSRINQVFISHFHGDHTGGLFDILAKCNKPTLYLPFSYPQTPSEPHTDKSDSDFNSLLGDLKPLVSEIIQKKESGEIGDSFYITGMMEDQTYEQALIVPTSKGLIIITGCAHPGILEIVRRAKELMKQDVYFVMGGFHLIRTDSMQVKTIALELRKLTKYIGPCHCTGEKAQGIFKDIFKEDYIDIQAGLKLKLGEGNL
jgi:7,8-dihydropterin-6-yl-methyl-4-(beta-D-ribofuranosyl)aminobenzene 5'-phosphate synthase